MLDKKTIVANLIRIADELDNTKDFEAADELSQVAYRIAQIGEYNPLDDEIAGQVNNVQKQQSTDPDGRIPVSARDAKIQQMKQERTDMDKKIKDPNFIKWYQKTMALVRKNSQERWRQWDKQHVEKKRAAEAELDKAFLKVNRQKERLNAEFMYAKWYAQKKSPEDLSLDIVNSYLPSLKEGYLLKQNNIMGEQ